MGGEEKRHQMMQNLFGDQSEEEEELESEHESNPQLNYPSVRSPTSKFHYKFTHIQILFKISLDLFDSVSFIHFKDRIRNSKCNQIFLCFFFKFNFCRMKEREV